MSVTILFPADPLDRQRVDPDYAAERRAAKAYFQTAIIDLDTLIEKGKVTITDFLGKLGQVIYRGWMLRPEQYKCLADGIGARGGAMITDFAAYTAAHLLPNWADHPHTLTARWTTKLDDKSLLNLLGKFNGPVTVKDFVKSRKNEWDSAFFIPDTRDQEKALAVIHNFIERQGDFLVGGVVLRDFVQFKKIGYFHSEPIYEEYRVYYWRNKLFSIYNYWTDDPVLLSDVDQEFIAQQAGGIDSPFITIDFARLVDGTLTIMEIGDGQVSGLQGCPPELFYSRLGDHAK
ncbi:hypothetical protein LFYK43_12970 [Ligilactobacillus salitolerans]|uniref:ATP-grasp domain-containing protein n=1 Tax=Ligilactobacillus salitolerans TaxID=1808352 RepID=A0A401ITJ2_9LACO|nr:ATP-grasp domain-containing protein [Ligilactobacillus salitolerans]GBG94838.1 hypothetical protein LFYK43_12970 [Ligilactobacillus salitolerans]